MAGTSAGAKKGWATRKGGGGPRTKALARKADKEGMGKKLKSNYQKAKNYKTYKKAEAASKRKSKRSAVDIERDNFWGGMMGKSYKKGKRR